MLRTRWSTLSLLVLTLAGAVPAARADEPETIVVGDLLVLPRTGGARTGRSPVQPDPVALELVKGGFAPPKEGDEVKPASGPPVRWAKAPAPRPAGAGGPAGGGGRGGVGYAFASVPSATDRVMVLEATGHSLVYVNGEPRAGDVYGYGYVKLPVRLKAGDNTVLFQGGRGQLKATFVAPRNKSGLQVETGDPTLPDLVAGEKLEAWAAVVVLNTREAASPAAEIRASIGGGPEVVTRLPTLPPLSARKVGFRVEASAFEAEGKQDLRVRLVGADGATVDESRLDIRVRKPGQSRRQTFVSGIDGSVQYFGFVPASPGGDPKEGKPSLILTLHGASVEGQGQADVYAPRPWAHVVAPTNRRPYGFDWEDWGRLDAIEVLDLAAKQFDHDPSRVYLTGHSMGGHGTWHLGVTFPDRFAAIAPSAGWVSMASYAGARPVEAASPVATLLGRPALPSDTLALVPNLTNLGVYVLHGSADSNVPVTQARQMRQQLGGFHRDFVYYEKPGAEHWWGNECCDWPPLMDFLRRHEIPARKDVPRVDFLTANPGVSSRYHWAAVETQEHAFQTSALHLAYDPKARRFSGTTENVARLALDLGHVEPGGPVTVEVDGTTFENVDRPAGADARVWLEKGKAKGSWSAVPKPPAALKGPHRSGPFKDAFRNRVVFVYGTRGTAAENAWSLAKARFDAERFWYQGNASVDVVPDSAFDPAAEPDRNVVVYGHADGNSAWDALLGKAPVRVGRGRLELGGKTREAGDLACLFVAPRPGSDVASVGAVCGTGLDGLRLTDKLPYFTSGVEYPDFVVLSPDVLAKGAEGVVAAGFFGNDWGVDSGEFAWAD